MPLPQPGLTPPLDYDTESGFNILVHLEDDADEYRMVVEVDKDTALTLTADEGMEWVKLMYRALAVAQHDRAVALQQADLGADVNMVASILTELRRGREPIVMERLGVELKPIVAFRTGGHLVPVVEIWKDGKGTGQWEEEAVGDHGQAILLCIASVPLDTAYLRFMRDTVNVPFGACTQVVAGLLKFRDPKLTLPPMDEAPDAPPSEEAEPPSAPG